MDRLPTTFGRTLPRMRRLLPMALALLAAGCGSDADRAAAPTPEPRQFAAAAEPSAEPRPDGRYLTASLTRKVRLYERPGGRVLTRIGTKTEFGSQAVLGVLARRDGWLKVVVSHLPNGTPGWVRARATVLHGTDLHIRVDRSERQAVLREGRRVLLRFPVAVGRPGNETPLGRYAVTDKLAPEDATSPYGCCAVALTGRQSKLVPGWPGGDRLAIHATPQPSSIGEAVSLGCLRAPTPVMRRLMRRVPLGAPVFVRA